MSGLYWHREFDSVAGSDIVVMPDSDGRRFRAGDQLLCWRSYYNSWLSAYVRHIGDLIWLDVEYPNSGIYLEIMPTVAFVEDVKKGLYKLDEKCYPDSV